MCYLCSSAVYKTTTFLRENWQPVAVGHEILKAISGNNINSTSHYTSSSYCLPLLSSFRLHVASAVSVSHNNIHALGLLECEETLPFHALVSNRPLYNSQDTNNTAGVVHVRVLTKTTASPRS